MNIELLNFINGLKTDEWQHVELSSRFKRYANYYHTHKSPNFKKKEWGRFARLTSGELWIIESNSYRPSGIYLTNTGMVFPAFSDSTLNSEETIFLQKLFANLQDKIKLVIGMHWQVTLIERVVPMAPQRTVDYRILTLEDNLQFHSRKDLSVIVRSASIEDLELLWPLERSYLREEVMDEDSMLNEDIACQLFANTLKNQLVYCAFSGNHPLAKGNTNARGWLYDQIGGVFVIPGIRNHGIGRLLMQQLVKEILQEERFCSLFVKDINFPALHLYQSLGFKDRGKFRISYWDE